jgi:hypothetical protein
MTADTDPVSVIRELRATMDEIIRIGDRDTNAWNNAKAARARFDALFNLQQAEQASWAMKDGVFLPFKKVWR